MILKHVCGAVIAIGLMSGVAIADDKKAPPLTVPPVNDTKDTRPFLERAADFLKRTKQNLKELEARAKGEAAIKKIEAEHTLKKAKQELQEAEVEYERLKKATKESAGDVSSGVKEALDSLSAAYRDAKSRFDQASKESGNKNEAK